MDQTAWKSDGTWGGRVGCAPLRVPAGEILLLGIFSFAVNMLCLAGPVFMLQVYDRVLPSRSGETLLMLVGLVIVLSARMGGPSILRGEIASRLGARLRSELDETLFAPTLAPPDSLSPGAPSTGRLRLTSLPRAKPNSSAFRVTARARWAWLPLRRAVGPPRARRVRAPAA